MKDLKVIPTRSESGLPNGVVVPIWHIDEGWPIEQVYLTTINPGMMKGPHLHMKRTGRFVCVSGDIKIVTRENGAYREHYSGDQSGPRMIEVPAGTPAALYNMGKNTALVLNLPNPAWRDNSDENKVEGWEYTVR